jgi:hypothetical protein
LRSIDDELVAVSEVFEFEFSLQIFGDDDDDDDKKDGCCLCLIKYCARRQSFSAKRKNCFVFKHFLSINNYMTT